MDAVSLPAGHAETAVTQRVRALLDGARVAYRALEHAPTRTSEESAAVRGEPLAIGGKALLLMVGGRFALFVVSAARKLDNAAIRAFLGARHLRFASPDELWQLTGLVPGSVPPFGEPVLPFALYVDDSIAANDRIAFNAGALTRSIIMAVPDYLALARPVRFAFSRAAD